MRFRTFLFLILFLAACTRPTSLPTVLPATEPIDFTLATIPPALTTTPPTQTYTPTVHVTPPPTPISPPIDFSITVQKFQSAIDGYILYGSYQWESPIDISHVFLDDVMIQDANGNIVQYEYANPAGVITAEAKKLPFAFKVLGKDFVFPLLISVESVTVILPDTANFQFDAGANPQAGDEWTPDIDVPINRYHIFVHKIKLISGSSPTEIGFNFTVWVGPNINIVNLDITDLDAISNVGSGGGGGEFTPGEIEYGWALEGYSPAGVKTFQISNLNIKVLGEWQATWQP